MKKHIVCIASEHKGNEFLDEAQNAGWHVTLVTRKKLLDEPWVWTALNDVKTVEDEASQDDYVRAITNIAGSRAIDRVVGLLEVKGPQLPFPYSSGIEGSRFEHMRELRIQSGGDPYRIFYAFDPRRTAILLVGGNKGGDDRFYDVMIPIADRLYDIYIE